MSIEDNPLDPLTYGPPIMSIEPDRPIGMMDLVASDSQRATRPDMASSNLVDHGEELRRLRRVRLALLVCSSLACVLVGAVVALVVLR